MIVTVNGRTTYVVIISSPESQPPTGNCQSATILAIPVHWMLQTTISIDGGKIVSSTGQG